MKEGYVLMDALVYCRVSSKVQETDSTSLDSQEMAGIAFAENLGYRVGRVTREVYSGVELWDRPLLSRDRADIKAGKFAALIAHSADRLSRDPIHLALIAEECERAGVTLLLVTEPLDNTPEGVLIRYVNGYAGRIEHERIRERQLRGKRQRALNGKIHNMGIELYGWRRDKLAGVRRIYEPEAIIAQRIFEWVAFEHLSARHVARRLNEQGVPPPSLGKVHFSDPNRKPHWAKRTIDVMIANPSYKGEAYAWRLRRPATPEEKRHKDYDYEAGKIVRPQTEWIRLPESTVPAIVSPELWEKANEAVRARALAWASYNKRRPQLLRGMVFCAICGRLVSGYMRYANVATPRLVYRCSSRDSVAGWCGAKTIRGDIFQAAIWDRVCDLVRRSNISHPITEAETHDSVESILDADLEIARREIVKHEEKQADLLARYSSVGDDGESSFPWELVDREIRRLEHEKKAWLAAAAALEQRINQQIAIAEESNVLERLCKEIAPVLDELDFAGKRNLLEHLKLRVVVRSTEDWELSSALS